MNVFGDAGSLADADLPGKFTENEIGGGFGSLKMLVVFPEIIDVQDAGGSGERGKFFADRNIVPMALVFAEIAKTLVGIEEQVFVPVVAFAVGKNAATLEADHFVVGAAQFSARAERDHRL